MNDTGFIWGMSLLGLVFAFEVLVIKRMWGDFHFRRYWRRRRGRHERLLRGKYIPVGRNPIRTRGWERRMIQLEAESDLIVRKDREMLQ